MIISSYKEKDFLQATHDFFAELNVPLNKIADEPASAKDLLNETYKEKEPFTNIKDVYVVGMVDDAAFEGKKSIEHDKIEADYDGILVFGVILNKRENNLLPTRSQLAEIARAFNRVYHYTPVVVLFKYEDDNTDYLAFANCERIKYKQKWREGEKAGKVSLLRDIDIHNLHAGHERILLELKIPDKGKNKVDNFTKLYTYWQEVFNVSILNKKFYQELSNWYFWAVNQVTFPNEPTLADAQRKNAKIEDLIQEHNSKNVIRLLTRLLFTWFIKEKNLIPEELFDIDSLQDDILKDISPFHDENGLFKEANKESIYYKAILQNLFFATLNCPIKPDKYDNRKRAFRGDKTYGKHRGIDYLYRYKKYFKNPDAFLELMNKAVPFLNGGLFECLDDKFSNLYIDGFSDQMTKGEKLIVPDYLFFGGEEYVDLSNEYGFKNRKTKQAAVKGLIGILKSYKFTITENTPIEEDVALDPELLGKVFENLLASYNPETKTTARKQTGSYYTPREIVNYMVDESIIAYLKNAVNEWEMDEKTLDKNLHLLASFDDVNPFSEKEELQRKIVFAIDKCKILDPACGSGAFPMGALQKMVHILKKLDPDNTIWKEAQRKKVLEETEKAFYIDDKKAREEKLVEINNAFDEKINNPDYARKLYLIENCIYGVDIQPIATQISKLRFFISLVVDQKNSKNPDENFNIQALPNLETRFIAANTLIGIEKPDAQLTLYDTDKIKKLEKELKIVRHKLFSARTKKTKLNYREKDEKLRKAIAEELKNSGWANETAEKLAKWDPYDQNTSSSFFDPEWIFDVKNGFDVVIGNPPYGVSIKGNDRKIILKHLDKVPDYEIYYFFIDVSSKFLNRKSGILSYIIPNTYLFNVFAENYRKQLVENWGIKSIIDFTNYSLFDTATVRNSVFVLSKGDKSEIVNYLPTQNSDLDLHSFINQEIKTLDIELFQEFLQNWALAFKLPKKIVNVVASIKKTSKPLNNYFPEISQGLIAYDKYKGQSQEIIDDRAYHFNDYREGLKYWLWGGDVVKYSVKWNGKDYIDYSKGIANPRKPKFFKNKRILVREITNPSIFAAITKHELYNDPAILIILDSKYSIEATALILNSKLGSFYHFNASPKATKGDFPKILVKDIKDFPISQNIEKLNEMLWSNVYYILEYVVEHNENLSTFYRIVDCIVFNLYFPDHMQERNIDVLKHVEKDIEEVMYPKLPASALDEHKQDVFETLSDTEKEEVIEKLHKKWTDPENEVVKRMAQFKEKSPDILKPILES